MDASNVLRRGQELARARFAACLTAILAVYLAIEALYVRRFPLIVDEIATGAVIRQLRDALPYRDFVPYKTVLGHYLQLPFLFLADDQWTNLIIGKFATAVMTAAGLFVAAWMLRKVFAREAIVLSLALLVVMSTFLERSAELRVDMLTAIPGLIGLVCLVRGGRISAGIWCALSFLVSQKGIYYLFATNAALAWLFVVRRPRWEAFGGIVRFNAAVVVVIALYAWGWSLVSTLPDVLGTMFLSPVRMAFGELYFIRGRFWGQVLSRDPFYAIFTVAALGLMVWLVRRGRATEASHVLLPYGTVLYALGVWHKQPWPYFFVLLIPTAFVIHAFAADWIGRNLAGSLNPGARLLVLSGVFFAGLVLPLTRLPVTLARDNTLQRGTIEMTRELVSADEEYLAGLDFVYDRRHTMPDVFGWLDTPRGLELLRSGAAHHDRIVKRMERAPLKVVITSYRTTKLPGPVREHLDRNFAPIWGPVRVYSPLVACGDFELRFSGVYAVDPAHPDVVTIDGQPLRPGQATALDAGSHRAGCEGEVRLLWHDDGLRRDFLPAYRDDTQLYPDVYSF